MKLTTTASLLGSLLLGMAFLNCNSTEIGDSKDVNQDKIYFDYLISYNDGDEDVTATIQYRFAGKKGTTLVINEPSRVEFDGEKLRADSSFGSGAFYKYRRPLRQFYGQHHITFTDINGKKYDNVFSFSPFYLEKIQAVATRGQAVQIAYKSAPLTENDRVELFSIDTDSSFQLYNNGTSNKFTIDAKEIQRQKEKAVSIQARLYQYFPLQKTTSEGGNLEIQCLSNPVKINISQ